MESERGGVAWARSAVGSRSLAGARWSRSLSGHPPCLKPSRTWGCYRRLDRDAGGRDEVAGRDGGDHGRSGRWGIVTLTSVGPFEPAFEHAVSIMQPFGRAS